MLLVTQVGGHCYQSVLVLDAVGRWSMDVGRDESQTRTLFEQQLNEFSADKTGGSGDKHRLDVVWEGEAGHGREESQ